MTEQTHEAWEKAVQEAIRSLRFGSVVVVVHEGKVTQIEKREKIRPAESRSPERVSIRNTVEPTLHGRPE